MDSSKKHNTGSVGVESVYNPIPFAEKQVVRCFTVILLFLSMVAYSRQLLCSYAAIFCVTVEQYAVAPNPGHTCYTGTVEKSTRFLPLNCLVSELSLTRQDRPNLGFP